MSPRSGRNGSPFRASVAAFAVLLAATCSASAQTADDEPTIEGLLESGWQIAGYTGAVDNWSTFVLFHIRTRRICCVQCRTGYGAVRSRA